MLIPELPSFLSKLGGADYKGLIISLFTLTAMISRPFSGKLADKLGRVPVMMAGCIVCFFCSLVLSFHHHGVYISDAAPGARFFYRASPPQGKPPYLSDVIPASRRGEAIGLLGSNGSFGHYRRTGARRFL